MYMHLIGKLATSILPILVHYSNPFVWINLFIFLNANFQFHAVELSCQWILMHHKFRGYLFNFNAKEKKLKKFSPCFYDFIFFIGLKCNSMMVCYLTNLIRKNNHFWQKHCIDRKKKPKNMASKTFRKSCSTNN